MAADLPMAQATQFQRLSISRPSQAAGHSPTQRLNRKVAQGANDMGPAIERGFWRRSVPQPRIAYGRCWECGWLGDR